MQSDDCVLSWLPLGFREQMAPGPESRETPVTLCMSDDCVLSWLPLGFREQMAPGPESRETPVTLCM